MTFTRTTNGLQQTDKRHQMILHVKVKALEGDKSRTSEHNFINQDHYMFKKYLKFIFVFNTNGVQGAHGGQIFTACGGMTHGN